MTFVGFYRRTVNGTMRSRGRGGGDPSNGLQERRLDRNPRDLQTDWMSGYGQRRRGRGWLLDGLPERLEGNRCHVVPRSRKAGEPVWCWCRHSLAGTCHAGDDSCRE